MKLGTMFRNDFGKGDFLTVVAIKGGGWSGWYSCDVVVGGNATPQPFTRIEVEGLIASGAWVPVVLAPPPKKGPPVCTKCGTENKYQPGPYLCWSCSHVR